MICGLPGSGKTTLAAKMENEQRVLRLTPDEWIVRMNEEGHKKGKRRLVESLQFDVALKALRLGVDVVLENGFWYRQEREHYRARAVSVGAEVKLHFLDISKDELKRRIENRNQNLSIGSCYVNPDYIDAWLEEFERPDAGELA